MQGTLNAAPRGLVYLTQKGRRLPESCYARVEELERLLLLNLPMEEAAAYRAALALPEYLL